MINQIYKLLEHINWIKKLIKIKRFNQFKISLVNSNKYHIKIQSKKKINIKGNNNNNTMKRSLMPNTKENKRMFTDKTIEKVTQIYNKLNFKKDTKNILPIL